MIVCSTSSQVPDHPSTITLARTGGSGATALATPVSSSTVMNYVFQRAKFELDLNKMHPLLVSPQGSVVYVSPALGVKSVRDIAKLKDQALTFGGGGPTGAEMRVSTLFELLGLNVKYVWGIARGPVRLAFERGEFNINYDTTPGFQKNASQLVKAGKAVPLFALGVLDDKGNLVRDPNFPDLPNFDEAYEVMHGKKPSGPAPKSPGFPPSALEPKTKTSSGAAATRLGSWPSFASCGSTLGLAGGTPRPRSVWELSGSR